MSRADFESSYRIMGRNMIVKSDESKNTLVDLRKQLSDLELNVPHQPTNPIADPRKGPWLPRIDFINKFNEFNRSYTEILNGWLKNTRDHQIKIDMLKEQITKLHSAYMLLIQNIKSFKQLHDLIVTTSQAGETGFNIEYGQYSDSVLDRFVQLGVHIDRPIQTIGSYYEESEYCDCGSALAYQCLTGHCHKIHEIRERNNEKKKEATTNTSGRVIIPMCFM